MNDCAAYGRMNGHVGPYFPISLYFIDLIFGNAPEKQPLFSRFYQMTRGINGLLVT